MTSFRPTGDKDWDYLRPSAAVRQFLRWEQRNPGVFELCVLDGWPSKVAKNQPDGSYATKDLFTPHPTTPDAWKYYSRLDDTIVLMNGEKANPITMEGSMRENIAVTEAVVFGNGKARLGVMVVPSAATVGLTDQAIIDSIWPTLTCANSVVPGYGKVSRDMVKILPQGTEYPRTDKGTVIRQAFYKQFAGQIDDAYEENLAAGALALSEPELRAFIRAELLRVLELRNPSILTDDTDFFSIGVDSLQTTQLRGAIVKNIDTNGTKLGQNVVFEYPSVSSLAKALFDIRMGVTSQQVSVEDTMNTLITKYGTFEQHRATPNNRDGQFIVVTGATGSLGAHVVSQLIRSEMVKTVYCPVRARSAASARIRVIKSMRERQVYHTLSLEARQKIVSLPSNFSEKSLGLDPEAYSEIIKNVTGVLHCAWSVNFNLGLGSFEKDCIAGRSFLTGIS
jgi:Male sterility protein/Phosphopantetheine attachment site